MCCSRADLRASSNNDTYMWFMNTGSGFERHISGDDLAFEEVLGVGAVDQAYTGILERWNPRLDCQSAPT